MATSAWISLGSNVGDRLAILDGAVRTLGRLDGIEVTRVSSYRETNPVGGPPGQGIFLNAAAHLKTSLSPQELLAATQAVEDQFGRVRTVRWGERTLDLDILIYGCRFVDELNLKLPHPRLAFRRFVLEPLVEIGPEVVDTISRRTVGELLANLDRRPRIVMIDEAMTALIRDLPNQLAGELSGIAIKTNRTNPQIMEDGPRLGQRIEIQRKTEKMRAAITSVSSDETRWIVFDFALDVPLIRGPFLIPSADDLSQDQLARVAQQDPRGATTQRMAEGILDLPSPTLIIAAPGSNLARKPNGSRTPIYWPEATEPAAIVAEVAAVCRGIETV